MAEIFVYVARSLSYSNQSFLQGESSQVNGDKRAGTKTWMAAPPCVSASPTSLHESGLPMDGVDFRLHDSRAQAQNHPEPAPIVVTANSMQVNNSFPFRPGTLHSIPSSLSSTHTPHNVCHRQGNPHKVGQCHPSYLTVGPPQEPVPRPEGHGRQRCRRDCGTSPFRFRKSDQEGRTSKDMGVKAMQ